MEIKNISTNELVPYINNARTHSPEQVSQIAASIKEFGFNNPILTDGDKGVIAGHGRLQAAVKLSLETVPVIELSHLSDVQKKAYILADNKLAMNAGWEDDILRLEIEGLDELGFDLDLLGFSADELGELLNPEDDDPYSEGKKGAMSDAFGVPPFTVLNAREGTWQDRKRAWISKGIKSELGRDESLISYSKISTAGEKDTSIFDPVLCELMYSWFCPDGGSIIDPFAGGSVRGVVASKLNRQYTGIELRAEQVQANIEQGVDLCESHYMPEWLTGDSRNIGAILCGREFDFLVTCPPYADLEIYSDNPNDLSTLGYEEFKEAYFGIIKKSCSLLKDNTFAVAVVGDVRGKDGNYYGFMPDTIDAFRLAGLSYYNEAVLITAVGSLPLRAGRAFKSSRKLGKTHQNILIFVKGDGKKAAQNCGDVFIVEMVAD